MVNGIIVTIVMNHPEVSIDMEIPCQIPVQTVCVQLLEALKIVTSPALNSCRKISLWDGDNKLRSDRSLAEAGVWDGSIITVIPEVWNATS